jgi:hypothetical protein
MQSGRIAVTRLLVVVQILGTGWKARSDEPRLDTFGYVRLDHGT